MKKKEKKGLLTTKEKTSLNYNFKYYMKNYSAPAGCFHILTFDSKCIVLSIDKKEGSVESPITYAELQSSCRIVGHMVLIGGLPKILTDIRKGEYLFPSIKFVLGNSRTVVATRLEQGKVNGWQILEATDNDLRDRIYNGQPGGFVTEDGPVIILWRIVR